MKTSIILLTIFLMLGLGYYHEKGNMSEGLYILGMLITGIFFVLADILTDIHKELKEFNKNRTAE